MLNGLLLVKGVVALSTFALASVAFLTMMQMRRKIRPIFPGSAQQLRRWHVASGRLAFVFFVLLAFVGSGLALYLYPPSAVRPWLHVIFGVATTVVFTGKIVIIRRKAQPWMRQLLTIGVVLFLLHLAIFLTATIWAYWFKLTGVL